jgi:hypothetical protein
VTWTLDAAAAVSVCFLKTKPPKSPVLLLYYWRLAGAGVHVVCWRAAPGPSLGPHTPGKEIIVYRLQNQGFTASHSFGN